ncbi:MAG: metallophosphoesterase [Clostridia bacterium]|nr:metallophosphoesterase [Clostridia bacterium]
MDFKVNVEHDGDINILQITDMQIIDANQRRFPDRIDGWKLTEWVPEKNDVNLYSHIKYLVKETKPDLIIITGDIIYGEFDDNGSSFVEFTEFMDSLEIPWAPVYGNHDNESYKGIDWQCEQFENAKYALFKRGNVFGNGNYTVGIYQNGELKRVLFMMDSNGCARINITDGFRDDQLAWIKEQSLKIHKTNPDVPFFICCHIPTRDFSDAYISAGYQKEHDESPEKFADYELGKDIPSKPGDFGRKRENVTHSKQVILPLLKECGFDGFFAGHYHVVNTSIMYEGIRFTFGLKTGYYDYYDEEANGGTLIALSGKDFSVKHIPYAAK